MEFACLVHCHAKTDMVLQTARPGLQQLAVADLEVEVEGSLLILQILGQVVLLQGAVNRALQTLGAQVDLLLW